MAGGVYIGMAPDSRAVGVPNKDQAGNGGVFYHNSVVRDICRGVYRGVVRAVYRGIFPADHVLYVDIGVAVSLLAESAIGSSLRVALR